MPAPTALYSVVQIREIERAAYAALPPGTLMRRAGEAAAGLAMQLIGSAPATASALVLSGPGNNGGDALEVAFHLAQAGVQVAILLFADAATQSADSSQALQRARQSSARFIDISNWAETVSSPWAIVIDGLFGIGLARPITGTLHEVIGAVNALPCHVLALDVPSGLDADTGNIVGDNGIAVRASHTITFIGNKPGLHTGHGRDYAGEVHADALQLGDGFFPPAKAALNTAELFATVPRPRAHASHKGSYGDVTIVGGAHGMAGATILAARAAAKSGAGRVFAAFLTEAPAYDAMQPELMCRTARDQDFSHGTLVIGPGLGTSREAHEQLQRALNTQQPLVLDADALNMIGSEPALQQYLSQRKAACIMTPHPLEAARLLGTTSAAVQADRLATAREISCRANAIVVLKGSGTVIARPDALIAVNATGNPGLATAGTGDVLAGICGALLAQGWPAYEAALGATWLHGRAADMLVEQGTGPTGLTASELIHQVRLSLNQLIDEHAQQRTTR